MAENKKEETKIVPDMSIETKKNFIHENSRILDYDTVALNAFIAILYYDERGCLSSPEPKNKDTGKIAPEEEYTMVNLEKINSKEKIDMIYNFLLNKLNSSKVSS